MSSYLFAVTRTWIRLVRLRLQFSVSDFFLFVSMLDALALIICDTISIHMGALNPNDPSPVSQLKVVFASNYFYDTGIFFPKLCILALYFTIIPITMPKLRIALYILATFTVLAALSVCLVDTFWCGLDISSNWSLDPGACSTWSSKFAFQYQYAINIICDSAIILLPIPVLRILRISKWQRFGVAATFGLGLITITICSMRFARLNNHATGVTAYVYIWSMAEYAASIIIVSLPSFKHIIAPRITQINGASPKSSYVLNAVSIESGIKREWSQLDGSTTDGCSLHKKNKLGNENKMTHHSTLETQLTSNEEGFSTLQEDDHERWRPT